MRLLSFIRKCHDVSSCYILLIRHMFIIIALDTNWPIRGPFGVFLWRIGRISLLRRIAGWVSQPIESRKTIWMYCEPVLILTNWLDMERSYEIF